ncbi:hypothetical protein KaCgl_22820 [Corynebacterium glutamicum]|nr:hypothetical protein KaCgl_22820 [Corynebacterium glutamicum]
MSENEIKGILGTKLGMTQIFDEENRVIPVTVVEAGPCVVSQIRTVETDGYNAIQIAYGEIDPRKVNQPLTGHFKKAGVTPAATSPRFVWTMSPVTRLDRTLPLKSSTTSSSLTSPVPPRVRATPAL